MAILALGLVIFLGLHSTRIFAEGGRAKAIARLGEGPWKAIYSLLSIIGFFLIVRGFAQARWNVVELWTPPVWARHITILLMFFSAILIGAYIFKKSHFAVAAHHPMVWSVAIWAAGTSCPTARAPTSCCSARSSSGRSPTFGVPMRETGATR